VSVPPSCLTATIVHTRRDGFSSSLFSSSLHTDCFIFLDVSLVARFLYREASRLRRTSSNLLASEIASADADTLLRALEDKAGKWHSFGLYLAEDVRRVKQGYRERPEFYERVL
jgi:hypothetical protein